MSQLNQGDAEMSSLESLWKQQNSSLGEIDVAMIRGRAERFAKKIRLRNATELAACGLVLATVLPSIFLDGPREVVPGLIAMAMGAIFVGVTILARAQNRDAPPLTAATQEVIVHERTEIERQAQLLEKVRWWYLGPLVPGVLLTLWGSLYSAYRHGRFEGANAPSSIAMTLFVHLVVLVAFAGIDWLNRRTAQKLRQQALQLNVT